MKLRRTFLILTILTLLFQISFSLTITDIGFPYKAFIYQSLKISYTEISNITITKETPYVMDFTYQGKKYHAQLFTYGAIYLEREGQNPVLISFDVREFRFGGYFIL